MFAGNKNGDICAPSSYATEKVAIFLYALINKLRKPQKCTRGKAEAQKKSSLAANQSAWRINLRNQWNEN